MSEQLVDWQQRKQEIREQAHANRKAQENKDELSRSICEKFVALPAIRSRPDGDVLRRRPHRSPHAALSARRP